MRELEGQLETLLSDAGRKTFLDRVTYLTGVNVPETVARRVASLAPLRSSLDVVQVGTVTSRPIAEVGAVYYSVGANLNLDWLRFAAEAIEPENHWERLAVTAIIDDLYGQQRALTNSVFMYADEHKGAKALEHWQEQHEKPISRSHELIEEFKGAGTVDIAKLAFANRQFRSMIS